MKLKQHMIKENNWNNKIMDNLSDILEILSSAPNFINIKTNIASLDPNSKVYKDFDHMVETLHKVLVAFSKNKIKGI